MPTRTTCVATESSKITGLFSLLSASSTQKRKKNIVVNQKKLCAPAKTGKQNRKPEKKKNQNLCLEVELSIVFIN